MPDLQEQLNQILSNPEALKQVQSLGEQLGIGGGNSAPPKPEPAPPPPLPQQSGLQNSMMSGDMMKAFSKIAPLMSSFKNDDETTVLLHSLRPFLSPERREKLEKAEKMLKLLKLLPLIKDNELFF
ncbi:MAG: hypothetical protein J1E85_09255 [Ruminococcus sp.]|nr:hypothetical protein [Ruminococcus sp.]